MKLNKKLGQHLLNNPSFYNNVLKTVNISDDDNIIEIGPGIGYFTKEILKYVSKITVFEIDKQFCYILKNHFKEKINVVNNDILKVNLEDYFSSEKRNIILGNLPYYITTPIIKLFIKHKKNISKAGIMVQKEFAHKLTAVPRTKSWTSMSVLYQTNFETEKVFSIDKKSFNPPPKVDSAFLIFQPMTDKYFDSEADYLKFSFFVKELFNQKRKMISNVLKKIFKDNNNLQEISAEFDLNKRAEEFSIEELVKIFNFFQQQVDTDFTD